MSRLTLLALKIQLCNSKKNEESNAENITNQLSASMFGGYEVDSGNSGCSNDFCQNPVCSESDYNNQCNNTTCSTALGQQNHICVNTTC